MNEIMRVALKACAKASEVAEKVRNSGNLNLNFKGDFNLCTEADIEAERAILKCIREKFPEHSILSEESDADFHNKDLNGPLWIIDPIDGTTNFAHGHAHVGISIAFADRSEVQTAVVGAPFQNETFTAAKGGGAFMNDSKIKISAVEKIELALVCTGFPYQRDNIEEIVNRLGRILRKCRDIRRLGAASLDICWLASGRLDVFYEDVNPWDIAAACLIAKEAGAVVDYFRELPQKPALPLDIHGSGLAVSNKYLMPQVLECIKID